VASVTGQLSYNKQQIIYDLKLPEWQYQMKPFRVFGPSGGCLCLHR
jgi:hypothetical protein